MKKVDWEYDQKPEIVSSSSSALITEYVDMTYFE